MACQEYVIGATCKAGEEGTYGVVVSFFDEDSVAVTPNNVKWSLYDQDKDIVNSRLDVVVTPAEIITITLSGDDLAIPDVKEPTRRVLIEYDYDSTLGADLPVKIEYVFTIQNLDNVS